MSTNREFKILNPNHPEPNLTNAVGIHVAQKKKRRGFKQTKQTQEETKLISRKSSKTKLENTKTLEDS